MHVEQNGYSFIARLPDERGTLHTAAEVITRHGANITRIHYDRKIDPTTVFFEIVAATGGYDLIERELLALGYLRTAFPAPGQLRFTVGLPHHSGALHEFLEHTTAAGANIVFIDFDERGQAGGVVAITLTLEDSAAVDSLLTTLQSRYPLEILAYDTTGAQLDDTVFYLRFAQQLREITGTVNDAFLMRLLGDINHIVQELASRGKNPAEVFGSILRTAHRIRDTRGSGFYADIQQLSPVKGSGLLCAQLPCGGSVFVFSSGGERIQVDTGYGAYYQELQDMFGRVLPGTGTTNRILITHADADHSGGAGYRPEPVLLSRGTFEVIREANRAYGSRIAGSILEEVYTHLINLFSGFNPPKNPVFLPSEGNAMMGPFPVLTCLEVGTVQFTVLGGLGGHLHGQIFLVAPEAGILFTGDSLINFASISRERMEYNGYADFLMTTVNVDSTSARAERAGLIALAQDIDRTLASEGRRCLICGGHGAVSVLEGERLRAIGEILHYTPASSGRG